MPGQLVPVQFIGVLANHGPGDTRSARLRLLHPGRLFSFLFFFHNPSLSSSNLILFGKNATNRNIARGQETKRAQRAADSVVAGVSPGQSEVESRIEQFIRQPNGSWLLSPSTLSFSLLASGPTMRSLQHSVSAHSPATSRPCARADSSRIQEIIASRLTKNGVR